ncbi:MAG: ferritin [Desulfuromonas sp.]|nr:MAG: ferritin [Desulfuromonas sp.]
METMTLQDAIRRSIQTEKNAMDFYLAGAQKMKNERARKSFEVLAREERDHARMFYDLYPGDDLPAFDDMIAAPPTRPEESFTEEERALFAAFDDRKAMELAMKKEQQLADHLRKMVDRFEDPEVRAIFEANVKSTDGHYQLIESEYAHLMGMVHETDIDTYVRE